MTRKFIIMMLPILAAVLYLPSPALSGIEGTATIDCTEGIHIRIGIRIDGAAFAPDGTTRTIHGGADRIGRETGAPSSVCAVSPLEVFRKIRRTYVAIRAVGRSLRHVVKRLVVPGRPHEHASADTPSRSHGHASADTPSHAKGRHAC